MAILFDTIVFGPVKSRRFGRSLGVNLLPLGNKVCNFNCVYCECGWTDLNPSQIRYFTQEDILNAVEQAFAGLQNKTSEIDCITFAGNGEPTMHPQFREIMQAVKILRDRHLPGKKLVVLSNGALLNTKKVVEGLMAADLRVIKLDAGTESMFRKLNKPLSSRSLDWYIEKLKGLRGNLILQTIFIEGEHEGQSLDNSSPEELEAWLLAVKAIAPQSVMLYSLDRSAPAPGVRALPKSKLDEICRKVEDLGIPCRAYA